MVSLRIGMLRAPSTVFKRKSSKKMACDDKKTDPTSDIENLSQSTHQSSDEGSDDDGDTNVDKHTVHLIGSMDSYDIDKTVHRRLVRSSSEGSFEVSDCVRELIRRRTSREYTTTKSIISQDRGVSFLDEELGLTPRHIVTEVHYRPRTSTKEKKTMHYCTKDFVLFERDHMYEKIEAEIKAIERQKRREQNEDLSIEDEESDKEPLDLEEVEKLAQKVRSRFNLEQAVCLEGPDSVL